MAVLERHIRRVLRRQVKAKKISSAQANQILDNPKALKEVARRANGLATSKGYRAIGDGSIIKFLIENWQTILEIVKAVIALF